MSDPVEVNLFKISRTEIANRGIEYIPSNLNDALVCMLASDFMQDVFGKDFLHQYAKVQSKELDETKLTVTELDYQLHMCV